MGVLSRSLTLGLLFQSRVSMRSMRSRSSLLREGGTGGYEPLMIWNIEWEGGA